jgi:acyl-CoA synthetase (AMP-forming)/AMP-acid ligase II
LRGGRSDVEIHADDIWEILFTLGATALPKDVMISNACSYAVGFGPPLADPLGCGSNPT